MRGPRLVGVGLVLVGGMLLTTGCLGRSVTPRWGGRHDLTFVTQRSRTGLLATRYPPTTVTTYVSDTRVIQDSVRRRTIVDVTKQTVTFIDKTALTFGEVGFAELRRALATADSGRAGDLPARQFVAGQLRSIRIEPTDETATIAGHRVTKYRMERGAATTELWLSDDLDVPPAVKEWIDIDTVVAPAGAALIRELSKRKGIVLKSNSWVMLGEQKQSLVAEVTEIRNAAPPDAVTQVPEGFEPVVWTQVAVP